MCLDTEGRNQRFSYLKYSKSEPLFLFQTHVFFDASCFFSCLAAFMFSGFSFLDVCAHRHYLLPWTRMMSLKGFVNSYRLLFHSPRAHYTACLIHTSTFTMKKFFLANNGCSREYLGLASGPRVQPGIEPSTFWLLDDLLYLLSSSQTAVWSLQ